MKYIKTPKIKVIHATFEDEFEEQFNSFMEALSNRGIQPTHLPPTIHGGEIVTFIDYQEVTMVPESCEDEYWLRGETYYCGNCPNFDEPEKKNVKYTECEYSSSRVRDCSCACEVLYKNLMRGIWELREFGGYAR